MAVTVCTDPRLGYTDPELDAILDRADRQLIGLLFSSFDVVKLSEQQLDRALAKAYSVWGEQPSGTGYAGDA